MKIFSIILLIFAVFFVWYIITNLKDYNDDSTGGPDDEIYNK